MLPIPHRTQTKLITKAYESLRDTGPPPLILLINIPFAYQVYWPPLVFKSNAIPPSKPLCITLSTQKALSLTL